MTAVPPRAVPRPEELPDRVTLARMRQLAHARLDPLTIEYLETGAADQRTVVANERDFERHRIAPHVLRDVSAVSTVTELLGHVFASPILVAPTGSHALFHAEGEKATARGAADAGCGYVMSGYSTTDPDDLEVDTSSMWLQVNVPPVRAVLDRIVERAGRHAALVVTVDTPVVGARESQTWDGLTLPPGLSFPLLDGLELRPEAGRGIYRTGLDASFGLDDLARIVEESSVPVVVKGIVRGDDARAAIDAGASAVIVSNHGGRNLDSGLSTVRALPGVVEGVAGRVPILLDGGIRRGTDVLIALALGASAVLVGRPILWGLTVAGSSGVRAVLDILGRELAMAMALCGVNTVTDIDTDLLSTDG
ncbi:alpha-hydroxy-acid oxidizing protein [Aeromicrobium sp. YIM 150415]|uniref:alpha-hydroxy acid oxidase n=1 Tax=Aeromicrobium sp. YIM 150415 TaxID=2803912 RepID=UPI001965A272|nr:alpha-hydroxy acid oxidase [Aeromicrobium sp. YIM 150415]MBM9464258.1 alpha-hydroxy-acid oxidizing protein [Aeromicrobium sp. YIM 150415]